MIAEHATSEAKRAIIGPLHWLWCFLFGFLCYAVKGMWGTAFISLIAFNGLLLILLILNKGLVRKHYEDQGWKVESG